MLINFVGCPASGKTTIAAKTFASLKEQGYPAEYIAERARYWIAISKQRREPLDDSYQNKIIMDQLEHETLMQESNPDAFIVADSSTLLTFLYLNDIEEFLSKHELNFLSKIIKRMESGLVFYCSPIPKLVVKNDMNRVHSYEQSVEIDKRIKPFFEKYAPQLKLINLDGPINFRSNQVMEAILGRI